MADSMEEELNSLWIEVEILTGTKYLKRKIPPDVSDHFSDETNQVIRNLKDLNQRINNRRDVRLLSRMQQELRNDGEMSPEMYLWWVNRY
ncbi:MAG: hypothetical protein HN962_05790 [Actinobacteria bacterium]|jgi:hypothetical protein|nr:hypothetical protein [Actinomycetota bacterium]